MSQKLDFKPIKKKKKKSLKIYNKIKLEFEQNKSLKKGHVGKPIYCTKAQCNKVAKTNRAITAYILIWKYLISHAIAQGIKKQNNEDCAGILCINFIILWL